MLIMSRNDTETWQECMFRYAEPYGLEDEVKSAFERFIDQGETEDMAAYYALAEWDLLEFKEDD